jgi:hypothetical protein
LTCSFDPFSAPIPTSVFDCIGMLIIEEIGFASFLAISAADSDFACAFTGVEAPAKARLVSAAIQ